MSHSQGETLLSRLNPRDRKVLHQFEIDCPNCGRLLRAIADKNKRGACPDCGNQQAICLPYHRFNYEWHGQELVRIKEKKAL